jgi:hypothetical protein
VGSSGKITKSCEKLSSMWNPRYADALQERRKADYLTDIFINNDTCTVHTYCEPKRSKNIEECSRFLFDARVIVRYHFRGSMELNAHILLLAYMGYL